MSYSGLWLDSLLNSNIIIPVRYSCREAHVALGPTWVFLLTFPF